MSARWCVLLILLLWIHSLSSLPYGTESQGKGVDKPDSMIYNKALLSSDRERDLEGITECSPYMSLVDKDKISISMYVYVKNNNQECLDSNLDLFMKGSSTLFLNRTLSSSDDRQSDTILCREFVELFKLVDLAGLTQAMCHQGVLKNLGYHHFCSTPLPGEIDVQSLVDTFEKDNLFKIASTYQFLTLLHNTSSGGCERVCGGNDNVFCNAFVNLTQFFVQQLRADSSPPEIGGVLASTPIADLSKSSVSELELFKKILQRSRTTLRDLHDIQDVLDSTHSRLLDKTLTRIFPMIGQKMLTAIHNNLEIVRYIVSDAISRKSKESKNPAVNSADKPTVSTYEDTGGKQDDWKLPQPVSTVRPEPKGTRSHPLYDKVKGMYYYYDGNGERWEGGFDSWESQVDVGVLQWKKVTTTPEIPVEMELTLAKDKKEEKSEGDKTFELPRRKPPPIAAITRHTEVGGWDREEESVYYRNRGQSRVWRAFKILVLVGFLFGTVYLFIRYNKKVREFVSPHMSKFRSVKI